MYVWCVLYMFGTCLQHKDVIEPLLTSIQSIAVKCEDVLSHVQGTPTPEQINTLGVGEITITIFNKIMFNFFKCLSQCCNYNFFRMCSKYNSTSFQIIVFLYIKGHVHEYV